MSHTSRSDASPPPPSRSDAVLANAQALAAAWGEGTRLAGLPEPVGSLEEAYQVQDAFVSLVGGIGGWKVAPLRPGVAPRCSPIPAASVREPSRNVQERRAGDWLIEVEIAVRLGSDLLPENGVVTRDAVAAAIAAVHPAIEIMASRIAPEADAPDFDRVADLQNCDGIIAGEGIRDWRNLDFAAQIAQLTRNGLTETAQTTHASTEATLDAVAWLAVHAAQRGTPLRSGQTIITGARLGPLPLKAEEEAVARVGALGAIHVARA